MSGTRQQPRGIRPGAATDPGLDPSFGLVRVVRGPGFRLVHARYPRPRPGHGLVRRGWTYAHTRTMAERLLLAAVGFVRGGLQLLGGLRALPDADVAGPSWSGRAEIDQAMGGADVTRAAARRPGGYPDSVEP